MTAFDDIKNCIENNRSFVLQGGAGSGKTETLKETLTFIGEKQKKKIVCITHTNLAVNEIKSRVGDGHFISTIHSFSNSFIKNYKKNIHQIIHHLFIIPGIERSGLVEYNGDETLQKKKEYEKYKKLHRKYASTLFIVHAERMPKVEGKKVYDGDHEQYNLHLNDKIVLLNNAIIDIIAAKAFDGIGYNETQFNSFSDLTYGHDGLLDITHILFERYPLIKKILQDKFDIVFIDEYQDTNKKTIEIFLRHFLDPEHNLVGLFGDSMQAIYEDGVGDVESFVNDNTLIKINKEDNYRCSEQVKDLINKLRNDDLLQEIAFKEKEGGAIETLADRQGTVELYYRIVGKKPHARSPEEEKNAYSQKLKDLILKALERNDGFVQLKLTNKSIASDVGFEILYSIFSNRYLDPQENLEKHLARLQFAELFDLCSAYKPTSGASANYNFVISQLKKRGFAIKTIADKQRIKDKFNVILNSEESAFTTLNHAFDLGLIKKSEGHLAYLERRDSFLENLKNNELYAEFKPLYLDGKNTFTRIKGDIPILEDEDFKELERSVKTEIFYKLMFSSKLKFEEILNYYRYLNEETQYITMHKTKGGEKENILVVLDEYFWGKYNFQSVFSENGDAEKKLKNQKLVYVACSRAKRNLICVKLVSDEIEEAEITSYFENYYKID